MGWVRDGFLARDKARLENEAVQNLGVSQHAEVPFPGVTLPGGRWLQQSSIDALQEQESCGRASRHLPQILQDGENADAPRVPLPGSLPCAGKSSSFSDASAGKAGWGRGGAQSGSPGVRH